MDTMPCGKLLLRVNRSHSDRSGRSVKSPRSSQGITGSLRRHGYFVRLNVKMSSRRSASHQIMLRIKWTHHITDVWSNIYPMACYGNSIQRPRRRRKKKIKLINFITFKHAILAFQNMFSLTFEMLNRFFSRLRRAGFSVFKQWSGIFKQWTITV